MVEDIVEKIISEFARTTEEIYTLEEFRKKLKSGKKLVIKYGVDVTAPFLHIGHAVNLWMMRKLQEYGHKVVFLIGDFTTRIGDPTGRDETRPIIPEEEIEKNAQEFIKQVSMVLITDDPEVFEIRRNSEWFSKMPLDKFISLLSMVTHARLISRDMFQRRIKDGKEIYMHEIIYPILQGYDSYMLKSDLTIVGSDQLFNEMMGRFFQEKFGQEPQVIITTKITPGLDGKHKQSKSLGNYVALADTPRDKFGKIMTLPDELIIQWMEVYTEIPMEKIKEIENKMKNGLLNPRDAKLELAYAIVERYHGKEVAEREKEWFIKTFSKKEIPTDVPSVEVEKGEYTLLEIVKKCEPNKSNSEIRRLILQGGVKIFDKKITNPKEIISVKDEIILKIGKKKFCKVIGV
ncbi:tyrosine--tRNA ligase [Candidatus Pacearchaeota archaeon]|nr:MAG: tyrosine--tRNA ligase [Candidatus Pacearchaeota archaeon]